MLLATVANRIKNAKITETSSVDLMSSWLVGPDDLSLPLRVMVSSRMVLKNERHHLQETKDRKETFIWEASSLPSSSSIQLPTSWIIKTILVPNIKNIT